jgi:hypothetical protein
MTYINSPAGSGNNVSSPDATPIDILGDIDIRVRLAMFDWTPAPLGGVMIAKWGSTAGEASYIFQMFTTDRLRFNWSPDGVSFLNATATAATGIADGTIGWVRATFDADNGAAGNSVKFYKADGSITNPTSGDWTQIGSTVTAAGTSSIQNSTGVLQVGGASIPLSSLNAKVYRAQIRNNILDDGTGIVLDIDPSNLAAGQKVFNESSSNAAVVTLAGQSVIRTRELTNAPGNYGKSVTVGDGMGTVGGTS